MSTPFPSKRLPTLTEVVDVKPPAPAVVPPSSALSEDELRKQILADIQRQVDQMLEVRLREARGELASSLRDIVARAVAQELSRHREP